MLDRPPLNATTPKVIELADRLVVDIQSKGLEPGDKYLTTVSAARMLGVGNTLANRALQVLERREIISRQQKKGAIISNPRKGDASLLRCIHFVVHSQFLKTEGIGNDFVLLGMQKELPGVHVQISFLPTGAPVEFVTDLIDHSLKSKAKDGLILVRAPYEVHQAVSESGVPAVVYGGVYPGVKRLPRLDRDMAAIGRFAAEFLLNRGHRRLAMLSRQQVLPGDQLKYEAILNCLAEYELPATRLSQRFLPPAQNVFEAAVKMLLNSDDPPTGFICSSLRMAEAVQAECEKAGLSLGDEIDLFLLDYYLPNNEKPRFPFARPEYSSEEQGRHIARMLAALAKGELVDDETIPVALDESACHPSQ